MDENRRPRPARVRRGSSPDVIARLQRSRRRALDRRVAQREREKIVTTAVRDYINAWHAIGLVQQRRDTDIADLNRRIQDRTARAEDEIAGHEQAQAAAAAAIQGQGHTDNDIAELFEISTKRARQLISASRKAETSGTGQPGTDPRKPNGPGVLGPEKPALSPQTGRATGSAPGVEERDDASP